MRNHLINFYLPHRRRQRFSLRKVFYPHPHFFLPEICAHAESREVVIFYIYICFVHAAASFFRLRHLSACLWCVLCDAYKWPLQIWEVWTIRGRGGCVVAIFSRRQSRVIDSNFVGRIYLLFARAFKWVVICLAATTTTKLVKCEMTSFQQSFFFVSFILFQCITNMNKNICGHGKNLAMAKIHFRVIKCNALCWQKSDSICWCGARNR